MNVQFERKTELVAREVVGEEEGMVMAAGGMRMLATEDGASSASGRAAFEATLREQLAEREARVQVLTAQRAAIERELQQVRRQHEALRVLLDDAEPEAATTLTDAPAALPEAATRRGGRVPPRRPRFATTTLGDAAATLLSDGRPWPVADLVREIFVVGDAAQQRAARMSLSPALSQGVLEGRWQRPRAGVYQLAAEPTE